MKSVSPQELRTLLDEGKAVLIDIREPYEVEICQINATHIPMAQVASKVNDFDKDKLCVIMCKTGKRAAAVANLLITDHGRVNTAILEGGIIAWIEQIDTHLETY